jgi:phthiocerol/phenolphthiocerol synthesis type-I polyketide synthase D
MKSNVPELGIMFFSASEESLLVDKYRLVMEAARFADQNGFSSVWVPERHFATLGGLYPNPSVLHAAIAAVTTRVALRAGSVVLPLHDPVRVAEEWSMVDNLSGGRVGISFASGWNPADFVFFPERYAKRHDEMFAAVPVVQRLWRGETVVARGGDGREVPVRILPRPVQPELPTWITAARSPETFVRAGEIGANVLTHLLDQDVAGVAEKVRLYREARARNGFDPAGGVVTVMVHTFIAADAHVAIETARRPYCEFLKSNASLLQGLAASRGGNVDIAAFSEAERDVFVNFLYDRFVGSRALIGSPQTCRDLVMQLWRAGVDEIACLLDFGPAYDDVLDNLPQLDQLRQLCANEAMDEANVRARSAEVSPAPRDNSLEAVQARCAPPIEAAAFYQGLERRGLKIEGDIKAVQRAWRRDGEAIGMVEIAARADGTTTAIAPSLLDACLQLAIAAAPRSAEHLHVPAGFRSLEVIASPGLRAWSHAVIRSEGPAGLEADVRILDHDGNCAASVTGLRLRRTEPRPRQTIGSWLYQLDWQHRPPPETGVAPSGRWLILADRGDVGTQLAARLHEAGSTSIVIHRDEVFGMDVDGIDDESFKRLGARLEREYARGGELAGVVHLWSLDTVSPDQTTRQSLQHAESWGSAAALVIIQSLLVPRTARSPRLWLVTRGAHAIGADAAPVAFAQAPLWGLGKTCAMEHPEIWGGLIDLDPDPGMGAAAAARSLAQALAATDGEDQVAFRNGVRHVARLVRAEEPESHPFEVHRDGCYLVTGGLWGLGLEVARWLVDKGARHLVLLGRTDLPARDAWAGVPPESDVGARVAALRELEDLGAAVRYAAVDVADVDEVASLIETLAREGIPRVRGVVHAASVWRDPDGQSLIRTLGQLDVLALRRVFAPKVIGTWALHQAFRDEPLDFFVLFSSAASLTGSAGQGNYAAASGFLDGMAHYRRQTGRSALSVNWGPVSGSGFGATPDGLKVHRYWEDNGLKRIDPAGVLSALELLIPSGVPTIGVMNVDWKQLGALFPALARSRWASELVPASTLRTEISGLLVELRAAPAGARRALLRKHVQDQVRQVMGLDRLPDPRRRLFDMGLDSLMALDIKKRLQDQLGTDISVTAVFNYPTIDGLVGYLVSDVLQLADDEVATVATVATIDVADPLARIKELTDDEAERHLAERAAAAAAATAAEVRS